MKNNYEIKDILSAVDSLLYSNKKEEPQSINVIDKPLILNDEIKKEDQKNDKVPKNTEKIILQAEKFLKK
tara:strand:- start:4347 stop:4556 length:210 start_codon:yes stop_codon:yes gene_type:complete